MLSGKAVFGADCRGKEVAVDPFDLETMQQMRRSRIAYDRSPFGGDHGRDEV
jgi:hypothetical protein